MEKFELFDFQKEAWQTCMDLIQSPKPKPSIVCAPVAYGKSGVISEVARTAGMPCLVLQPSSELLKQNLEKLRLLGGDATVYSASLNTKEMSELTYATLGSVKNLGKEFKKQGIKLLLIDEADSGYPPDKMSMFMKFVRDLGPHCAIGFTATPLYLKNSMEGSRLCMVNRVRPSYFKDIIYTMQISEIIARGRWTPIKYKAYEFDEKMLILNSTGADFTEESIKQYNKAKGINNKIYLEIKQLLSEGMDGILVFCDSVESAIKFSEHIPDSAAVYGDMPKKERERVLEDFKSGKLKAVFNYQVLGVGYDNPSLRVVIYGRATNSFRIYYQSVGRGVRKHSGKTHFQFIDYGGNVARFGEIESVEILNHPVNGWSIFSNKRLITGVPMGGAPIYEHELVAKEELPVPTAIDYTFDWGKWEGSKIQNVPRSYIEYMIYGSGFAMDTGKMLVFKKVATKYLEETKLAQL